MNVRSSVKARLKAGSTSYEIAKKVYRFLRISLDSAACKCMNPTARIVVHRPSTIANRQAHGLASQYGQDAVLLKLLSSDSVPKTFIDIGCNHPTLLSNTLALEAAGWTGYALDPLSRFADDWKAQRVAQFVQAGVSSTSGFRDFAVVEAHKGWEHTLSGFLESVRQEDLRQYGYDIISVPVAPLQQLVHVDGPVGLICIDVEGAEWQVLDGIDLDLFSPSAILIENVSKIGGDSRLRRRLGEHGYRFVCRIGAADDVFIKVGDRL